MELSNRVAFITGAGSGIGQAIALRMGQEGAMILVNDSDAKKNSGYRGKNS